MRVSPVLLVPCVHSFRTSCYSTPCFVVDTAPHFLHHGHHHRSHQELPGHQPAPAQRQVRCKAFDVLPRSSRCPVGWYIERSGVSGEMRAL